jgi:hypothetical protein
MIAAEEMQHIIHPVSAHHISFPHELIRILFKSLFETDRNDPR